jgi:hypothetical protein
MKAVRFAMKRRKDFRNGQASRAETSAAMDRLERSYDAFEIGGVPAGGDSLHSAVGLLDSIGADKSTCKKCGSVIWWVVTKNGKKAPFTAQGVNHFADCPGAEEVRRETHKRAVK